MVGAGSVLSTHHVVTRCESLNNRLLLVSRDESEGPIPYLVSHLKKLALIAPKMMA